MVMNERYVGGAKKLQQRIATIRRNLALPALTSEIGDLLYRRTMDRFRRMVDPDENPWKDLAPATLRRKQAEGYGDAQKLVRKGFLRDSIQKITGGISGALFINTGAGVRIGITDPGVAEYAAVQNRGSRDGRIPARRFLGIGRLDVKSVDSFLRRKANNLGLD
ncbi:tail completion or Neck1 protein [Pseudomonas phage SM1]|uniref:Structural protein n=2 Tax=Samunavirus TaxID=2560221 RepID=A0AAU8KYA6_9CAUD|nr:tail completion or Neck1 protein [Pseudomonas phage SM1]UGV19892.1 hypothetical protein [Pseudomonas phage Pa BHU-15]UIW13668.1 hypothetical protein [Pseudomonas phage Pa BHU-17]WDS62440.1 hypothetical protein UFRH6_9 [Pseudomonas phage UF_RH6]HBO9768528.1 hypothetical protein [Pseudomonas aeruginosa]ALT57997.1 putative virion morphogenesis protein [Pseudomonas phage SM1]